LSVIPEIPNSKAIRNLSRNDEQKSVKFWYKYRNCGLDKKQPPKGNAAPANWRALDFSANILYTNGVITPRQARSFLWRLL
jgi:hypothetical protein